MDDNPYVYSFFFKTKTDSYKQLSVLKSCITAGGTKLCMTIALTPAQTATTVGNGYYIVAQNLVQGYSGIYYYYYSLISLLFWLGDYGHSQVQKLSKVMVLLKGDME